MQLAFQYIRNSRVLLTVIGFGLLFFCGQVSIPIQPVAITLQTVAMLVIGLTFSKADALKSVTSYLMLGALGAPVFANFSGGFAKLMGPAGGFYFGFLVAVWVMCTLRERFSNANANTNTKEMLLIAFAGQTTLYVSGVLWLCAYVSPDKAISFGLVPFILPGIVKSLLVAAAVRYLKK
jgi:biotin transport system substrate-specific component